MNTMFSGNDDCGVMNWSFTFGNLKRKILTPYFYMRGYRGMCQVVSELKVAVLVPLGNGKRKGY